ncbi:hypothetical protein DBN73_17460, partial [Enterococcus faecalis]|uniref:WxL protein peptidoglycan domain-containing protein n=1 Tax=Enterococcus faecalis TaxID=1351 RepID=UPI00155FBA3B
LFTTETPFCSSKLSVDSFSIKVKPPTNTPSNISLGIFKCATTNDNGIADYNGKKEKDSTLKYDLSDLIEIDKEIVVPSNGET